MLEFRKGVDFIQNLLAQLFRYRYFLNNDKLMVLRAEALEDLAICAFTELFAEFDIFKHLTFIRVLNLASLPVAIKTLIILATSFTIFI